MWNLRQAAIGKGPRQELVTPSYWGKAFLHIFAAYSSIIWVCCHQCPWIHGLRLKRLYPSGGDTSSCLGPYPMVACPEFHIGCRVESRTFTFIICCYWCPWSHGLNSKRLYQSVVVTPAPVRLPTLWPFFLLTFVQIFCKYSLSIQILWSCCHYIWPICKKIIAVYL